MFMLVQAHAVHADAEVSGPRQRKTTSAETADITGKCMDKNWPSSFGLTG